ncbi:MAG: type II toxin-antitoxin system RelE family toxin [Thermoproteota archaeon]
MLHRKAVKELNSLSPTLGSRVRETIREMKANPFSGDVKPVKGFKGVFRRRVGDYRIIFTVSFEENTIVILRISHRGKAYENI